jgi:hypothetical protein
LLEDGAIVREWGLEEAAERVARDVDRVFG